MLVDRMRSVATDSHPVKNRNSHRSEEVSIRSTANLRFAQLKPHLRGDHSRFFE